MRNARSLPTLVIPVLAVLLAAAPARAAAPNREEAQARSAAQAEFERGLKKYRDNDFEGALSSFRAAYEASPNAKVLWNVAYLEEALGESAAAYRDYRRYLELAGTQVPAERRDEVARAMRRLSARLAWVVVDSRQAGAVVEVDGEAVGSAPARVPLDPGKHRVVLRAGDKAVDEAPVEVEAGASVALTLGQAPAPPKAAAPEPPRIVAAAAAPEAPEAAPSSGGSLTPWVAWGTTAALAGATIATGVITTSRLSDLDRAKATFGVTRAELDAKQGSARDMAIATAALGGATLASAVIATWLSVRIDGNDRGGAARVTHVAVGPAGVSFGGTF